MPRVFWPQSYSQKQRRVEPGRARLASMNNSGSAISRTPRPCGNSSVLRGAVASWSAAVLCRFHIADHCRQPLVCRQEGFGTSPAAACRTLSSPHHEENTQQPTSNVERPMAASWAILGCWTSDVGCWMFPGPMRKGTTYPISPTVLSPIAAPALPAYSIPP